MYRSAASVSGPRSDRIALPSVPPYSALRTCLIRPEGSDVAPSLIAQLPMYTQKVLSMSLMEQHSAPEMTLAKFSSSRAAVLKAAYRSPTHHMLGMNHGCMHIQSPWHATNLQLFFNSMVG
eukprot:266801-Chlamydomonas_euryale.AAC.8